MPTLGCGCLDFVFLTFIDLDLFTTQNVQVDEIHMKKKKKKLVWPLTSEGWPWHWHFPTQNVQLHEIHMHAKYQVAIFNIAKVMANVKFLDDDDGRAKDESWLWQYLGFSLKTAALKISPALFEDSNYFKTEGKGISALYIHYSIFCFS